MHLAFWSAPLRSTSNRMRAPSARELEERAISLAASLIHAAEREGYEVGLTVMGSDMTPIAPRKSQWHVRKLMAALASIDLDGPRSAVMPGPVRDAERAGLVVVMPDRIAMLPGRESAMYLSARQMANLVAEVPAGRRSESAVAEHERAVAARLDGVPAAAEAAHTALAPFAAP